MRKPCCDKQHTNRGAWSKQEDQKLIDYICKHGEVRWCTLPQAAGLLRCWKSCRMRWMNYLRPDLKKDNFAEDEEDLIIKLHALLGNRWSLIAGRLPGRTDNEVKNFWNSHLRRKLIDMGIDPNNHRLSISIPRTQNPNNSTNEASPRLKTEAKKQIPTRGDRGQVSDAGSCSKDESCRLPDLNLDLSMGIPSTSMTNVEEKQKDNIEFNASRKIEVTASPTLLLFQ